MSKAQSEPNFVTLGHSCWQWSLVPDMYLRKCFTLVSNLSTVPWSRQNCQVWSVQATAVYLLYNIAICFMVCGVRWLGKMVWFRWSSGGRQRFLGFHSKQFQHALYIRSWNGDVYGITIVSQSGFNSRSTFNSNPFGSSSRKTLISSGLPQQEGHPHNVVHIVL